MGFFGIFVAVSKVLGMIKVMYTEILLGGVIVCILESVQHRQTHITAGFIHRLVLTLGFFFFFLLSKNLRVVA